MQVRFIRAVISKEIKISNRKSAELLKQLSDMKFDAFPKGKSAVCLLVYLKYKVKRK